MHLIYYLIFILLYLLIYIDSSQWKSKNMKWNLCSEKHSPTYIKYNSRNKKDSKNLGLPSHIIKHHIWAVYRKHNVLVSKKVFIKLQMRSGDSETNQCPVWGSDTRWSLGTRWLRMLSFCFITLVLPHPSLYLTCLF